MGDAVSISFKNGNNESVALFCHIGGKLFVEFAEFYGKQLREKSNSWLAKDASILRQEPNVAMAEFIRFATSDNSAAELCLYLGKDHEDGDNSDLGHHVIDLGD